MFGWLSRTTYIVAATATLAIASPPVATGAVAKETIAGTYELKVAKTATDGQQACVERWTLRANGTLMIQSGQENLQGHWGAEGKSDNAEWLLWTGLTTNGMPDCRGKVTSRPVADRRIPYYVNSLGGLVLLKPGSRLPDGSMLWSLDAITTKVPE